MRRSLTARAEIVWGLHDSATEMELPNAIDHHARGERILGIGDPLGELQPTAGGSVWWQFIPAEDRRKVTGDFIAEPFWIATQLQLRIRRLSIGDRVGIVDSRSFRSDGHAFLASLGQNLRRGIDGGLFVAVQAEMIKALTPHVIVDLAVQDSAEIATATAGLLGYGLTQDVINTKIRFHKIRHNDIWWRDMGGVFLKSEVNKQRIVDFNFNGWGYAPYTNAVGQMGFALDETVDRQIAAELNLSTVASSIPSALRVCAAGFKNERRRISIEI